VLVERFPVAVGLAVGLLVAVTGIFVLSMPAYHSPIDRTMLGTSSQLHYTVPEVRRAFRVRGLTLPSSNAALNGVTVAAADPTLYVFVAKEKIDPGPRDPAAYERRIGNVLVHYGGTDKGVLARVKAVASALAGD
jgi:hypothetical protein